jgi:hypothetical protein
MEKTVVAVVAWMLPLPLPGACPRLPIVNLGITDGRCIAETAVGAAKIAASGERARNKATAVAFALHASVSKSAAQ